MFNWGRLRKTMKVWRDVTVSKINRMTRQRVFQFSTAARRTDPHHWGETAIAPGLDDWLRFSQGLAGAAQTDAKWREPTWLSSHSVPFGTNCWLFFSTGPLQSIALASSQHGLWIYQHTPRERKRRLPAWACNLERHHHAVFCCLSRLESAQTQGKGFRTHILMGGRANNLTLSWSYFRR